jgi:hypothetical protein
MILAISAFVAAPALAAEDLSNASSDITAENTEQAEGAQTIAAQETETEAADDKAESQEPKMVCRYVKSSTSRVGQRVCSPAKQ